MRWQHPFILSCHSEGATRLKHLTISALIFRQITKKCITVRHSEGAQRLRNLSISLLILDKSQKKRMHPFSVVYLKSWLRLGKIPRRANDGKKWRVVKLFLLAQNQGKTCSQLPENKQEE
ncbi:MAG TPA: hypothetical protein PLL88_00810 [Anaerolineaceae bacterium]|nr:hypothetical protein [Anaerolineaceae bacterium]